VIKIYLNHGLAARAEIVNTRAAVKVAHAHSDSKACSTSFFSLSAALGVTAFALTALSAPSELKKRPKKERSAMEVWFL
jgi:hypothetical protein